jgi:hypothetical protein
MIVFKFFFINKSWITTQVWVQDIHYGGVFFVMRKATGKQTLSYLVKLSEQLCFANSIAKNKSQKSLFPEEP